VAQAEPADQSFAEKAATGGMTEVELGKLAQKQSTTAEVKKFGKKMITDHSKGGTQLKALAKKKNMTLPSEMTAEQRALYDRLAKLSGAEFDQAYMEAMQKDHDEDVAEFKKEADSGRDPDLKAWAAKMLPTLQEHDEMAHHHQK